MSTETTRPALSYLALAAVAAMFAVELSTGAIGDDAAMLSLGALPDSGELHGQYWRLLSYAFLHAGWTHFALNGALLAWVGPIVERRLGARQFALLFATSALAGGIGIWIKHVMHPAPGVSVGASGALFALLGAALVLLHAERTAGAPRTALWVVLVAGLASSLMAGVSLVGHLVGLAIGVAWTAPRLVSRTSATPPSAS